MSPNLQEILSRLKDQLESMSEAEYQEQVSLIDQMNDGPSADDLIRSFHEASINYTVVFQQDYNININPFDTEYPITARGYSFSLAA